MHKLRTDGAHLSREELIAPLLTQTHKVSLDILPSYGDILSTDDVSEGFGISASNVRQMCRENRIPHFKAGSQYRFPKAWLCEWVEAGGRLE